MVFVAAHSAWNEIIVKSPRKWRYIEELHDDSYNAYALVPVDNRSV